MNDRFRLCISTDCYDHKPTDADCRRIRFDERTVSIEEFVELIKEGYAYTSLMKDNWRCGDNFICTNLITFDIDHSTTTMNDCIEGLEIKPTVAYTSSRNGLEGYGFGYRLVYLVEDEICSLEEYSKLSKCLAEQLELEFVDDKSYKGEQMWFGCKDCTVYLSNEKIKKEYIILKRECKKRNATTLESGGFELNSFKNNILNNNFNSKNKSVNQTITITQYHNGLSDTFQMDYKTLSFQELINKYRTVFPNIERTPIELNEEEPIIKYPRNYYEIRRPWKRINGEVMKIKDGENRRKKLFLNGIIRRKINPNISFDNLLFNLVYEFEYYYINNGNKIDKKILFDIAMNVMKADIKDNDLGKPRYKSFVNPLYCQKNNLTKKQVMGKLRNKKQYIGEFYDFLLTDKENIESMKELGFDISIETLKRWKKENNIRKYKK